MKIDDSFKKPGSIPFKWEVRPGVPKLRPTQYVFGDHESKPDEFQKQKPRQQVIPDAPFPKTPPKLKPPPAGLYFQPHLEPRTPSFRSPSKSRSKRFGKIIMGPDIVSSGGCFPSPLAKRKNGKKDIAKPGSSPGSESSYSLDLDTPPRWSVSSRRSVSPLSSSFASYQSSPRPVSDSEWATFGLF